MPGEDSLLSLLLKVEGGQASAAEVQQLEASLASLDKEITKDQNGLEEKFSKKFEHVALKSFLADGIRSIGLSGEMRPILSVLQMSLMGVVGAMNLWAVGLAAVSGLLYAAYNHFKEHTEALTETAKAQNEVMTSTQDLVDKLEKYEGLIKKLPKNLQDLKTATLELKNAQALQSEGTEKELLETANKHLLKLKETIPTLQENIDKWEYLSKNKDVDERIQERLNASLEKSRQALSDQQVEISKTDAEVKTHTANLIALHKGFSSATDAVERNTAAEEKNKAAKEKSAKAAKDLADAHQKASALIDVATQTELDKLNQYASEERALTGDIFKSKEAAVQAWVDKEKAAENKHYQETLSRLKDSNISTEQLSRTHQDVLVQIEATGRAKKQAELEKLVGVEHTAMADMQKVALNTANAIEKGFSQSLAKTIVSHQSMGKLLVAVERQVAEQAVAEIIEVGLKRASLFVLEQTQSKAATAAQIADITSLSAAHTAEAAAVQAASVSIAASLAFVNASVKALTMSYVELAVAEKAALI